MARFVLSENGFKHIRSNRFENYRDIIKSALSDVFKNYAAEKLGISLSTKSKELPSAPVENEIQLQDIDEGIYDIVVKRLIFLCGKDEALFSATDEIYFESLRTKCVVFYKNQNKGRILDVVRGSEFLYSISDGENNLSSKNISELDQQLISLFKKRVSELK